MYHICIDIISISVLEINLQCGDVKGKGTKFKPSIFTTNKLTDEKSYKDALELVQETSCPSTRLDPNKPQYQNLGSIRPRSSSKSNVKDSFIGRIPKIEQEHVIRDEDEPEFDMVLEGSVSKSFRKALVVFFEVDLELLLLNTCVGQKGAQHQRLT